MTKKKGCRQKHQKDVSFADTSDEEFNDMNTQGKNCPHVTRGIHFGRVKKALKSTQSVHTCSGCSTENTEEEQSEVWLCLQCGYRGCGRTSQNKHGLQHFKTLHSDCHSLVLSTTSGCVWCYDCDDEINLQSSRVLKQCVEFVMKMIPNASNISSTENVNKVINQNIQNSVIKEETSVQKSEDSTASEKMKKPIKSNKELSSPKVQIKGLRNLGNTCFFNAVMQNLSQSALFFHELKNTCNSHHQWEVPELIVANNEVTEHTDYLKLSLPRQFILTNSLLNFFEQMNAISSAKVDIVNPSLLFGEISKKCPQFRHFQQQDSHELLRQLLDGVRQEEIRRQKKAILKNFELENVSPENVDDEMKKKFKAYGCYASHTIIEKVFGGLLISTVLCEECKGSSQVFEPFMDLSLPLFEEKQQENSEQLYGMLDGGKQDHTKPLRNRKSDLEFDENTSGEYVLSKPKNDFGKPSKHQEKKQKQLAKKEKKRTKSVRNRKTSLSELNDKADDTLPETVDEINEGEEKNKDDFDEQDILDNQNDESCEISKFNETNEISAENDKLSLATGENLSTENCEELDVIKYNEDNSENTEFDQLAENQNEKIDEASGFIKPNEDSYVESELNHLDDKPHSEGEYEEQEVKSIEQENTELDYMTNSFESNAKSKEIEDEVNDIEGDLTSCAKAIRELTTENNKSMNEGNIVQEVLKTAAEEIEGDQNCDKDGGLVNPNEEIDEVSSKNQDDSIHNLTKDFSNCLTLSELNHSSLEDRIQALSMQVKGVRIRRDSDRQENMLNSSESTDDDYESQKTNCTSPKSSIEDTCSNDNGENWSHSVSEQQTKEWILKSLTTLKPRHHVSALECSINSCLSHFTKPELLTGNNKFRCENCTELKIRKTGNKKDVAYTNASKQMLIFSPPAILTLHLKRFQQVGMSLRKVNRFVEFPLVLDLAPFCSSACTILPHMVSVEEDILYSLYGIVEHSGRLTSGHYTAYVKASKRTINRTFECQLPLAQCNLEQLLHKFSGSNHNSSSDSFENSNEESRQWFYISDGHVKEVSEAHVLKCQAYLLFYERIK